MRLCATIKTIKPLAHWLTPDRLQTALDAIRCGSLTDRPSIWRAKTMSRKYTNQLIEMIEESIIHKDTVILACLNYMSEDDVRDMMEANEFIIDEEEDEESEQ